MLLMRHGQSEFNVIYGETRQDPGIEDPRLTETGRQQVAAAVQAVAGLSLRRVVTSPYTRALETAEIVASALDLPITVEPLVRERRAFVCDIGTMRSALSDRWPALDFAHLDETWWPAHEESETELTARCTAFQARMAQTNDWPHVAVISHWGFIRGLTGEALANADTLQFDPT